MHGNEIFLKLEKQKEKKVGNRSRNTNIYFALFTENAIFFFKEGKFEGNIHADLIDQKKKSKGKKRKRIREKSEKIYHKKIATLIPDGKVF